MLPAYWEVHRPHLSSPEISLPCLEINPWTFVLTYPEVTSKQNTNNVFTSIHRGNKIEADGLLCWAVQTGKGNINIRELSWGLGKNVWGMSVEGDFLKIKSDGNILIPEQNSKSLRAAVMVYAILVNTDVSALPHINRQKFTALNPLCRAQNDTSVTGIASTGCTKNWIILESLWLLWAYMAMPKGISYVEMSSYLSAIRLVCWLLSLNTLCVSSEKPYRTENINLIYARRSIVQDSSLEINDDFEHLLSWKEFRCL